MKKLFSIILVIIVVAMSFCFTSCKDDEIFLTRDDWEEGVKDNLNQLIKTYKNSNEYVVFDFDNTSCIFDIEEQLAIYQLETMSFNILPTNLKSILLTDLDTSAESYINGYGYFDSAHENINLTYNDLADDIVTAYTYLYDNYGPFTSNGLSNEALTQISGQDNFNEFKTKMRMMYDLVYDKESSNVAYPWITYWFTGMSESEVYNLAKKSHEYYSNCDTAKITWSTNIATSKTGAVTFTWTKGIKVTENIKELYKAFAENNIDVWVCSASQIDVVRGAVDVFGLHDYVKGVLAMTNAIENNKIVNQYDYVTGYGYLSLADNSWTKMDSATKAQPQGVGKVKAINNTIYGLYGNKGPIAGFMDSTGDFNFCTEYDSLKLVVCFNRGNRKVTDGGGLIAPLAMYQKDILGYDLKKANDNGDTLYLLQGRDENGQRTLRPSNKSVLYGNVEETLYKNNDNQLLYDTFVSNSLSTKDIINTYSIKTTDSQLGIKYGFLTTYDGYHNIKND